MLQPVVEKKGCEMILANMRDCLVETHRWDKCDEEVQKFQECINMRYFEHIEEKIEPEVGVNKDDGVKSEEDAVEVDVIAEMGEETESEQIDEKDEEEMNKDDGVKSEEDAFKVDVIDEISEETKSEQLDEKDDKSPDESSEKNESDPIEGEEDNSGDKESFSVKLTDMHDSIEESNNLDQKEDKNPVKEQLLENEPLGENDDESLEEIDCNQTEKEDPLEPVVERKGCEKIWANMKDCLVETNCYDKCDEEVLKFQECINTRYFEDIDEKIEPEVEVDKDDMKLEEDEDIDRKIEPIDGKIEPEVEVGKNDEVKLEEDVDVIDVSKDKNESDQTEEEENSGDKDSFRVKIVTKNEMDDELDENLLFNISVIKPNADTKT